MKVFSSLNGWRQQQPVHLSCLVLVLITRMMDSTFGFSLMPTPTSRQGVVASLSSTVSSNQELVPGIQAINQLNEGLFEKLDCIRSDPYFRYFSVDILASCEYMPQELFECYTESCEIYPADEEEIPAEMRSVDRDDHYFELDGWARWDMPTEDYFDTKVFPESYTGYNGAEVWDFIHNRICFQGYQHGDNHWKADFNKAVSGLHSMISAQVIRGIQERLDAGEEFTEEEIWRDPRAEFAKRLSPQGPTPLALENLYFCYMLLLKAAANAKPRLLRECQSGVISGSAADRLKEVLDCALLDEPSIGIASQKLQEHAMQEPNEGGLWEARMRSRDLLRIMNCVQCNKCRLHGKISVLGLTTALQLTVGPAGQGGDPNTIHRVELAALMKTLHKFSRVIKFCQQMQA